MASPNPDACMLGLFERKGNRVQLHAGVGWNINRPIPQLFGHDNRGYGMAGPSGYCYTASGAFQVIGRQLADPFLARYGYRGGRHRTEVFNPFTANYTYVGRHRAAVDD